MHFREIITNFKGRHPVVLFITEIQSESVQTQLSTFTTHNYMFRPILDHPQVHNLCLKHTDLYFFLNMF
jgi:hypothetical protein